MANASSKWPFGVLVVVIVAAGILALTRHPVTAPIETDTLQAGSDEQKQPTDNAASIETRTVLINHAGAKGSGSLEIDEASDTLHVVASITKLPLNAAEYALVGEHIYYINQLDQDGSSGHPHIEWMDFAGNAHALSFTDTAIASRAVASSGGIASFVVSADETQIAWTANSITTGNSLTETIWTSNLNGTNVKQVLEETGDAEAYLTLLRFDARGENLYFEEQHGGIGGYILTPMSWPIKVVDLTSGLVTSIAASADDIDASGSRYVTSLGADLIIHDIKTGIETKATLDLDPNLGGGIGGAQFSPDGSLIAFMINQGDVETGVERFRVMVYDPEKKMGYTVSDQPGSSEKSFVKWLSDDLMLLEDGDQHLWTVHANGTGLAQI